MKNNAVNSINLLDYSIFSGQLNQIYSEHKISINTINQYSLCIAENDYEFKKSLTQSDILLPDGMAIVKAVKFITGNKIEKIAGSDVHLFLLSELNKKKGKCFYLGSAENTLKKIRQRLANEFPNIQVETFSPPFQASFSKSEDKQMIAAINAFRPDVLFIGMTAPKQEKWSHLNKEELNVKIVCSIGAVFDFYAETIVRPHPFWIKLSLEWFIRLIKEPKRMWKRYLYFGPVFIKLILKEKIKLAK
ncbi:WecB/TagA/CpsF family glycosyltransferase [Flavobacterium luteum]|uniref:WecB/TagA/CpsF family glycosyltransferase n=1 Tax=Flavobacterium luteum TaxID=2026654 RepID=A0A7J5AE01_9FLAO|nr:WecB/TagA/CpsF family glycosyltransferase [Flavobacterium luteum]KAB1155792.1 WecB/TagA/CpsF family glycosyltransferase [Flavobacterium luteum]